MQLAMNYSINIEDDEDVEEQKGEEKSLHCKECWIFKRNKNYVDHPSSKSSKCDQASDVIDRFAEHQKFLSRLKEYQQSLPYEKTIKPATVTQVASDAAGEMINLFVNNNIAHDKHKLNVKAILSSLQKKIEHPVGHSSVFADLDTNSIFSNTNRSLRLGRKCKQKSNPSLFALDIDDVDLLFQDEPNTKVRGKGTRQVNGEVGKCAQSIVEMVEEDLLPADKTNSETVSSSMLNTKKRKMDEMGKDGKGSTQDDFISVSHSKNANAYLHPKPANPKVFSKRKVNGVVESKKIDDVIEIGGDNEENDEANAKTESPSSVNCPMCNKLFTVDNINDHAYTCQGPQTQTRSKQTNVSALFDPTAWTDAAKGLNCGGIATATKIKEPVMDIPNSAKSENKFESRSREKTKQANSKDPLREVKFPSKFDNKTKNLNLCTEAQHTRLLNTRTSGYHHVSMDKMDKMDKSTQELIQGYAMTMHKVRNPSKAKQLRIFDESNSEERGTRCARCDQYFPDDQLKSHTDQCLEKSVVIE